MSVWRCPNCGCTLTWILDRRPPCPYCSTRAARPDDGLMQQVTDE